MSPRISIIPAQAVCDSRLKPRDLQVLCLLGRHTNNNGWCRRSQVKMAKELHCARSTVQAALLNLCEHGYVGKREIKTPHLPGERDSAHEYRVLLDQPDIAEGIDFAATYGDTPADIPAPPADPGPAPPADPGPAPINDSTINDTSLTDVKTPRQELETVLDAQRADAVLAHRQRIRKPLTAYGAQRLAVKFAACPDPNAGADLMIERGWQGFEPQWYQNSVDRSGKKHRNEDLIQAFADEARKP